MGHPENLIIGEASSLLTEVGLSMVRLKLTHWIKDFFATEYANPTIEATYRSARQRSYDSKDKYTELKLGGEVELLMKFLRRQMEDDSTMKSVWSNCKLYEQPYVKLYGREDRLKFSFQLGKVDILVFFEGSFEGLTSFTEEIQFSAPPVVTDESSQESSSDSNYADRPHGLKQKLLSNKSAPKDSDCSWCTIS